MSCWHFGSIPVCYTRGGRFEPFYCNDKYFYWSQRSCGQGNIFTPVCHSVHRRGGVCLSACWDTTPQSRHPPGSRHPLEQTPPGSRHPPWKQTHPLSRHPPGADTSPQSRHPPEQTPPRADTPWEQTPSWSRHPPGSRHPSPWEADSSIRSMSGRYAFFWNAFLLSLNSVRTNLIVPLNSLS